MQYAFRKKVPTWNWVLMGKLWVRIRRWKQNYWWGYVNVFILPSQRGSEKAMAPHSSTLAWKIPWMEEPGGLQSMGSLGVGHDWATSLSLFTFMHWRRKWQPTPVFLPGESQGRGTWWGAVYGVAQSRTWLKRLSSSSSQRGKEWWVLVAGTETAVEVSGPHFSGELWKQF